MENEHACILCGEKMNGKEDVCLNCRARLARGGVLGDCRLLYKDSVCLMMGLPDQKSVQRRLLELDTAVVLCFRET